MAAAVARAAEVPEADVRRALTLSGDLAETAAIALGDGPRGAGAGAAAGRAPALPHARRPPRPTSAPRSRSTGPAAVEYKLDGARVQIHRDGDDVAVFTRTLDDVTAHVPEAVEAALALPARSAVLDGEVIALRDDGRPHPFQVTGSRFGARRDLERLRREIPLSVVLLRPPAPRRARTCSTRRSPSARRRSTRSPRTAGSRTRSPRTPARRRRSSTPRSPPATRA